MSSSKPKNSLLSAMFLVGGTCIGGGILLLPIVTGGGGFVPSLVMMFFCWLAMTMSALLLLEASLWMEEGAHVITITSRILGPFGKAVAWLLFLYVSYASLVAYTAVGGAQVSLVSDFLFGITLSKGFGCLIFISAFGFVLYLGSTILGRVNSILFFGLIGAYIALVFSGVDEINPSLLTRVNWRQSLVALPVLLTSFSFQTLVPSLTSYLKRDAKALRKAIVGGTSIAFVIYALWQSVLLGIVPYEGADGFGEGLVGGSMPATHFLQQHVKGFHVGAIAKFFEFFAIVTSFLGIALGLFDFLSDGLKIKEEGVGQVALGLLVAIPTLLCAVYIERVFTTALDSTGGFGDTILNGIIPVMLVWIGRYRLGYDSEGGRFGGKGLLLFVGLFFLAIFLQELLSVTGIINSVYLPDALLVDNS